MTMSKLDRLVSWATVLLIVGCGAPSASKTAKPAVKGDAPAAAPALPTAAEVLDRYVEVTGGRAAYEKVTSMVMTGTMAMPAMNLEGKVEVSMAPPRQMHFRVTIPGIGEQERGTDGALAWEKATMTGNRILEGNERAQFLRESTFNADLAWRELYTKAEVVALEPVDGNPAFKVVLTSPENTTQTRYYDQASGLLVRTEMSAETNMGTMPVEALASDYRQVGALSMAFRLVSKTMGMEQVITLDKVDLDTIIPADRFAIPPEIQALIPK